MIDHQKQFEGQMNAVGIVDLVNISRYYTMSDLPNHLPAKITFDDQSSPHYVYKMQLEMSHSKLVTISDYVPQLNRR